MVVAAKEGIKENISVSPNAAPVPGGHLEFLDGLRALAALFVLLHHAWLTVWRIEDKHEPVGWMRLCTNWLFYGHFAVAIFIVLSGFCLMLPLVRGDGTLKGGAGRFYQKRAWRILPTYYCALLLALLLIRVCLHEDTGSLWDHSLHVTGVGLVANLLMLQNLFGRAQINYPFWSVAVEWQIYFLFPLLVLLWKRIGPIKTTLASVGLALLGVATLHHTRLAGLTLQYYALFVFGMFGATIAYSREDRWVSLRERINWHVGTGLAVGGLVALCAALGWQRAFAAYDYLDFLVGLCTLLTLVAATRAGRNPVRAPLRWRPLVFIGGYAYSLYLTHAMILQIVWQYALRPLELGSNATFLWLLVWGVPACLAGAYLFYLSCEQPFLTRRKAIRARA